MVAIMELIYLQLNKLLSSGLNNFLVKKLLRLNLWIIFYFLKKNRNDGLIKKALRPLFRYILLGLFDR